MTISRPRPQRSRRGVRRLAPVAVLTLVSALGACAAASGGSQASGQAATVWDPRTVHEVSVDIDPDDLTQMLTTYQETGEKEWLRVDVTIDGETVRDAGIRLKGNSSLRAVSTDSDPADLPWLIDLDQFVDDQRIDEWEAFVIRSNTTQTSLNEAVALDLLQSAGLASQEAVAVSFSANDGEESLRLMVQDLDNRWDEAVFDNEGTLYKSESGGDWSYRGDEPEAYEDVFDIEAGTDDYAPLTDFLQWLNESSDAEFEADLPDRLDVDAFASYLALEHLMANMDDIDGPGNNSFLRWDASTEQMTVVAWDHNLAFGVSNGGGAGGGPGGGPGGRAVPSAGGAPEAPTNEDMTPPDGAPDAAGAGQVAAPSQSNVLADRFMEVDTFVQLYEEALETLQSDLFDSGTAQDVLDAWSTLLTEQAGDLVTSSTVDAEAADVAVYFDGRGVDEQSMQAPGAAGRP